MEAVRAAIADIPLWAGRDLSRSSLRFVGGVTNSSYCVTIGEQSWIVRIPGAAARKLIDRGAEHHNSLAAAALDLTVPDHFFDRATGVKVGRFLDGLAPLGEGELREPGMLRDVASLLRALHGSGAHFEAAFSPGQSFVRCSKWLRAAGHGIPAPIAAAEARFQYCRALLDEDAPPRVPCHQDLWRENIIRLNGRLLLIDWEHSAAGDAMYDLADLSVQAGLSSDEEQTLLGEYLGRPLASAERIRFRRSAILSRFVWGAWAVTRALLDPSAGAAVWERGVTLLARAGAEMEGEGRTVSRRDAPRRRARGRSDRLRG